MTSLLVIVSLLSYLAGATTVAILVRWVRGKRAADAEAAATEYFNKLSLIMEHYVEGHEGKFCFPDGDIWDCKPLPKPPFGSVGFHKNDYPHG